MKRATALSLVLCPLLAAGAFAADQVKTLNGVVQAAADSTPAVRMFKGIPFAEPPVGELRWKAPQPAKAWAGVRPGDSFGPRCMQRAVFPDMVFRSNGVSEDCLYLNVWTPAKSNKERLPVLVYFFGGGFMAGDGSEPRYDGASMASKGIVAVTVNYRLGIFGFLAHAELSQEAPYMSSGNYGLLDQSAALHWVNQNIAAFGGDPKRVTIAGESAGSISVSAQVVSPLSKDLIAGGILESGSLIGTLSPQALPAAERDGAQFAESVPASSIAALPRDDGRAGPRGGGQARSATLPAHLRRLLLAAAGADAAGDGRPGPRAAARGLELGGDARSGAAPAERADAGELREGRERALRRQGRRGAEALPRIHAGRGPRVRDGARERSLHRLQHVAIHGRAREDLGPAGLSLLLCPPAAEVPRRLPRVARRTAGAAPARGARRGPLRRDRVRHGKPRRRTATSSGSRPTTRCPR